MTLRDGKGRIRAAAPAALRPLRTLIVDDSADFREVLALTLSRRQTLQLTGTAGSGREAVTLAARLQPDLVIVDLVLPDFDGFEVTRRVRRSSDPPCVIVLSLAEHPAFEQQARAAGAQAIVNKHDVNARLMRVVFECCRPSCPAPGPVDRA